MPPRHSYWTILIDNAPTAFRSATREELQPTFERLRRKHPSAVMRWFARGRVWASPDEAEQAARAPREPRTPSWRPGGRHKDPREAARLKRKERNAERRAERFERRQERDQPRPATPFDGPRHERPRPAMDTRPQQPSGFRPDARREERRPQGSRPGAERRSPYAPKGPAADRFASKGRKDARGPGAPPGRPPFKGGPPRKAGPGWRPAGQGGAPRADRDWRTAGGHGKRPFENRRPAGPHGKPRRDDRGGARDGTRYDSAGERRENRQAPTNARTKHGPGRRPHPSPVEPPRPAREKPPAPPFGPDRPPRPGQEPSPEPTRPEEIVVPHDLPERGRVEGPGGSRLVKRGRRP